MADPHFQLLSGSDDLHGFKPQRGIDYPFQLPVIAFNDDVQGLNLWVFNVRRTPAFAFKPGERTTVCRGFIRIEEAGDLPAFLVI